MATPRSDAERVVVTGAGGFVGRALVAQLRARGNDVVALTRAAFDVTTDELPLDGVRRVYHAAARTGVPAAWDNPVDFYRVNAHGTLRVLEACRRADCPIVYVSAYIYGRNAPLPVGEDAPLAADNPYAFSKLAAEDACRFYAEQRGLAVTIVRPFNIYGEGQDERFLLPWIARQAVDPARAQIELMDLAPRRDYVHVDDVVAAIVELGTRDVRGRFNVGSGESHSVAEVAATIVRLAGAEKPVVAIGTPRPNEIADVRADIARIRAAIGWQPRVALEDGLRRVVEDMRSR